MAARQPKFITQALAELRKRRPCRSCGRLFRPERIDALTCSETCRWRRSHGQPDYIDSLNTEQAVLEARQFHARIEYLLKEVQAHTAADRERRRQVAKVRAVVEQATAVQTLLNTVRAEAERLRDLASALPPTIPVPLSEAEPDTQAKSRAVKEQTTAVRTLLDALRAEGEKLRDLNIERQSATAIAGPGISPGGGTPKMGATAGVSTVWTAIPGSAIPSRPLSPEATAVVEKIFQAWRIEVIRALNEALQAGARTPDQIQTFVIKALPHIPPEAIVTILKEL
jgi:hypothetical protein